MMGPSIASKGSSRLSAIPCSGLLCNRYPRHLGFVGGDDYAHDAAVVVGGLDHQRFEVGGPRVGHEGLDQVPACGTVRQLDLLAVEKRCEYSQVLQNVD